MREHIIQISHPRADGRAAPTLLEEQVRGRLVNAFSQTVVDRAMTSVVETIEAEWGR